MGGYVLAIDLGTSALKVALVGTDGRVAAHGEEACEVTLLPGGGAEQDPRQWWDLIAKASSALMGQAGVVAGPVRAVCCTAQWSGTVATGADGEPVHPAIIWLDSRGAPYVRQITGGPVRVQGYGVASLARWIRLTGGVPTHSGKDPIAHILWLKHARPDAYAAARWFLEPKDWLNLKLTGRAAATYDSIALHWLTDNRDPGKIAYHPGLLRLAGVDRAQLPDLMGATGIVGPLLPAAAGALGVPAGIPVVAGTPDVCSAAIGSGATRDFQPHLYLGTSSWLTCHVPAKKTDLLRNIASLPAPVPGRYFVANEQETAGVAVTFARDLLLPGASYAELDRLAATASPGSGGVIFTPWLNGERTPVEDRLIRAGFHHLSLSATGADLARAVLEGVALNTRWLLGAVEKFTRRRLDPIRAIGGGARSDLWCQIMADVLNRRIEQVADPVTAGVRGAAMLASVALGDLTFGEIPDRVPVARTYQPSTAAARYDAVFAEFTGLYRRNRRAHARLARLAADDGPP